MSLATDISNETYTAIVAKRYSKREWTRGVQWCIRRGMCEGDIRNLMIMHAEAAAVEIVS